MSAAPPVRFSRYAFAYCIVAMVWFGFRGEHAASALSAVGALLSWVTLWIAQSD